MKVNLPKVQTARTTITLPSPEYHAEEFARMMHPAAMSARGRLLDDIAHQLLDKVTVGRPDQQGSQEFELRGFVFNLGEILSYIKDLLYGERPTVGKDILTTRYCTMKGGKNLSGDNDWVAKYTAVNFMRAWASRPENDREFKLSLSQEVSKYVPPMIEVDMSLELCFLTSRELAALVRFLQDDGELLGNLLCDMASIQRYSNKISNHTHTGTK